MVEPIARDTLMYPGVIFWLQGCDWAMLYTRETIESMQDVQMCLRNFNWYLDWN